MTPEEEALQAALDDDPADHFARGVLADHLEERNDPRAKGYRMLARLRRVPRVSDYELEAPWLFTHAGVVTDVPKTVGEFSPACVVADLHCLFPTWHPTRREAEDALARAFATLSPERQVEILFYEYLGLRRIV